MSVNKIMGLLIFSCPIIGLLGYAYIHDGVRAAAMVVLGVAIAGGMVACIYVGVNCI